MIWDKVGIFFEDQPSRVNENDFVCPYCSQKITGGKEKYRDHVVENHVVLGGGNQ